MMRLAFFASMSFFLAATAAGGTDIDYTKGVFIINEDWYGHQNSTVNYLIPDDPDGDYWHYRVFQTENPGMELGCTNQFGAIYNGRFYFIAKQDKDPGASVAGGRITVADARTMKVVKQLPLIDQSGAQCDGRAFLGVTDDKGYISTSNGVWVFDLRSLEVTGMIGGTANTSGSMYSAQCGTMILAGGRVFVAHQQSGVLVIDPDVDEVVETVSLESVDDDASIGSIVRSKDGFMWLSIAKGTSGSGATLPYIVRLDPETLEMTTFSLPDGIYPPSNSWYAWTPDGFCASTQNNVLYWNGGASSWFSQKKIFSYDIDRDEFSCIMDLDKEDGDWQLYGCSMRVHPVTDEIYMSLFHNFQDQTYKLRRADSSGNTIQEYSMIDNYWFPSIPVFPSSGDSGIGEDPESRTAVSAYYAGGMLYVYGACGETADVYTVSGSLAEKIHVDSDRFVSSLELERGIYVISIATYMMKIVVM